jgi:hypothetical protein
MTNALTAVMRVNQQPVCHQVAELAPDMFYNIYLVKNFKVAKNSRTTYREQISIDLESIEIQKKYLVFNKI